MIARDSSAKTTLVRRLPIRVGVSLACAFTLIAGVVAGVPWAVADEEREEYGKEDIWVYEVKLLTKKGSVLKLEYDAIHLELLKIKGRPEN